MAGRRFTPFEALDGILHEFVDGLRSVLGPRLSGVYLQGSFGLGDGDEHSDVDFVAAVEGELSDRDVESLQQLHGRIFDCDVSWAQHLEGSYFPLETLRRVDRAGSELWYLDNGARRMIRDRHCNTVVVRSALRSASIPLLGPPPTSLVDPVSETELRRDIDQTMCGWGREILADPARWSNRFYQGFIVLNYARTWCDLAAGSLGSKRRAAAWAKERVDRAFSDLIDRAWSTRPDPARSVATPADPHDFALTLEFLRMILDRCEELAVRFGLRA